MGIAVVERIIGFRSRWRSTGLAGGRQYMPFEVRSRTESRAGRDRLMVAERGPERCITEDVLINIEMISGELCIRTALIRNVAKMKNQIGRIAGSGGQHRIANGPLRAIAVSRVTKAPYAKWRL